MNRIRLYIKNILSTISLLGIIFLAAFGIFTLYTSFVTPFTATYETYEKITIIALNESKPKIYPWNDFTSNHALSIDSDSENLGLNRTEVLGLEANDNSATPSYITTALLLDYINILFDDIQPFNDITLETLVYDPTLMIFVLEDYSYRDASNQAYTVDFATDFTTSFSLMITPDSSISLTTDELTDLLQETNELINSQTFQSDLDSILTLLFKEPSLKEFNLEDIIATKYNGIVTAYLYEDMIYYQYVSQDAHVLTLMFSPYTMELTGVSYSGLNNLF